MKIHGLFTSECVSEGHPDKAADRVSDAILDYCLTQDPYTRAGVEVLLKGNMAVIAGEITSDSNIMNELDSVVRSALVEIGYDSPDRGFDATTCGIINLLSKQSGDIAMGVDTGGAGDQGIMFGGAVKYSGIDNNLMPLPAYISRLLTNRYTSLLKEGVLPWAKPDAKSQVTILYNEGVPVEIRRVLMSASHVEDVSLDHVREELYSRVIRPVLNLFPTLISSAIYPDSKDLMVNPTGRFVTCGPSADCGLTNRKIIVDTFGGYFSHGGGGLCLPGYQNIYTSEGSKPIQEVEVGDSVIVEDAPYKVVNKYDTGVKSNFTLRTRNGYTVDTSEDHLFKVVTPEGYSFKKAGDLTSDDFLVLDSRTGFGKLHRKDAYILGYLLGDGWLSKNNNSINIKVPKKDDNSQITEDFRSLFPNSKRYDNCNSERGEDSEELFKLFYCDKTYREELENLGFGPCGAKNKVIPPAFMNLDKESTAMLIRGLFDSDGCISKRSGNRDSLTIHFVSTSEALVRSLQILLLKFGIYTRITVTPPGKSFVFGREVLRSESFTLALVGLRSIELYDKFIGFGIPRKAALLSSLDRAEKDLSLIPGCKDILNNEYLTNPSFNSFVKENDKVLSSARKTFTRSGEESKRGRELTYNNIVEVLKCPDLTNETRLFLEERLSHLYDSFLSLTYIGDSQMYDIEVEGVHEFNADGFQVHNCGKDPTKVDRSAVYALRYFSNLLVKAGFASDVEMQMSYAIGVASPMSVMVDLKDTDNGWSGEDLAKNLERDFDLSPRGIIKKFDLQHPKGYNYREMASLGHFGRLIYPWESVTDADLAIVRKWG